AANGYAAPAGTAIHAVIQETLTQGRRPDRQDLHDALLDAFEEAVAKAQEQGDQHDPEQADRALDKLLGQQAAQLEWLLADPRLAAIKWLSLEEEIAWTDSAGRSWRCGIDAIGMATRDVPEFGFDGVERVGLHARELVVVDWK